MTKLNIAIIGAGLSGLTLAEKLAGEADITIFEKARGIGGRMSTRYANEFQFDHGVQFFTARSKSFQAFLRPFIEQNIVQEWKPKIITLEAGKKPYKRDWFEPHYTATPKMNMLCKAIAKNHDVRIKTEIDTLHKDSKGWFLSDKNSVNYGPFDWVISTAPAPQTAKLLPTEFARHTDIADVAMQGCYSLMLGFSEGLDLNWNTAKVKNSPIGSITVNSSKPSRDSDYSLLVQTTNEWAETHIDYDQDDVREALIQEVERLLERNVGDASYISLHRWRYANTVTGEDSESAAHFIDQALNLAACGDWCIEGDVESGYLSAISLAKAVQY